MTGYTPIFSKIVDSSIWCESDLVVKVFLTMLAKKDGDNIVRGSAFNIAQWSKKTEQEAIEALKVLAAPDTKRLEPQPFEGRRIEKVEDGWLILNGEEYQRLMVKINRRAYKAKHEAMRREKEKNGGKASEVKKAKNAVEVVIPENIDVPRFREAWEGWVLYQREKGKRLPASTVKLQLKKCEGMGIEKAIAAINNSITNNWAGIFESTGGTTQEKPRNRI